MHFVVYQDNGGHFHWRLMSDGITVAVSASAFPSPTAARAAAEQVHAGAGGATGPEA
jgi:uncharacterized protein YegP (UPF0339 family)